VDDWPFLRRSFRILRRIFSEIELSSASRSRRSARSFFRLLFSSTLSFLTF
jgi:hypothetical protein